MLSIIDRGYYITDLRSTLRVIFRGNSPHSAKPKTYTNYVGRHRTPGTPRPRALPGIVLRMSVAFNSS